MILCVQIRLENKQKATQNAKIVQIYAFLTLGSENMVFTFLTQSFPEISLSEKAILPFSPKSGPLPLRS